MPDRTYVFDGRFFEEADSIPAIIAITPPIKTSMIIHIAIMPFLSSIIPLCRLPSSV